MDGIVIINKPSGFTSQDVVSKVKKILKIKKAGHIGTLDPLAIGVFPVLLGNYTKLSKYLIEHDKTYIAKLKLGEKRDTGDLEGEIIEKSDKKISNEEEIKNVLNSFVGKQTQIPPKYSAIKVNGKKLYEYARNNEEVEIPKREIEIFEIKFLSFDEENQEIEFEVYCSKGTYIRTLCEDIAEKLGTFGYMKALKRTKVGDFKIQDAINLEDLNENSKTILISELFKDFPVVYLNENKERLFLNGVKLNCNLSDGPCSVYSENKKYIGIGIVKDNTLKRDVILN